MHKVRQTPRLELDGKNLNIPEGRKNYSEEDAFASNCLLAEKAALRLIARAEQCTAGLIRKLKRRGYEEICINTVISRLSELNLVSDSRYAQLWLQSRLRFTRSPKQLFSSLCGKGIDRDDAEAALKTVLDEKNEQALLSRFVKKHLRKTRDRNEDGMSLKHILKSEGFSLKIIDQFLELER